MAECSCGGSNMSQGTVHTPAICWYVAPDSTWDDQMIRDEMEEHAARLNEQHAEIARLRAELAARDGIDAQIARQRAVDAEQHPSYRQLIDDIGDALEVACQGRDLVRHIANMRDQLRSLYLVAEAADRAQAELTRLRAVAEVAERILRLGGILRVGGEHRKQLEEALRAWEDPR